MAVRAKRRKHSKTFYKYAIVFFCVIVLVSASLVTGSVIYAQRRVIRTQTSNAEASLQQAANELYNQFMVFSDVANLIGTDANYIPAMVKNNNYHDMEILSDFKRFQSYSPIADEFFLAYDFMDKIYVSSGYNSYFRY